jgi:putative membrane protein
MWMGPGMWWAMLGIPLVILGVLVSFGVWAIRRFSDGRLAKDARRILEERLARGEIDGEEFRSRMAALNEGTSA